jgi:predicted transposase/invertase (TIGR01784 family)
MDYASDMDSAERRGQIKGKAEGIVEGEARGIAKGEEKGITQTAKRMKKNGRPIEQIAEDTGLTAEEIEKL